MDRKYTGETQIKQRKSEQVQILKRWAQEVIDASVARGNNLGGIQREMNWKDDGSLSLTIRLDFGGGTWGEYTRSISADLQTVSSEGLIRQ